MGIEVLGLRDLGGPIPQVEEDGQTPLENARQKALAYYQAFQIPVFSCDSGLAKKYVILRKFVIELYMILILRTPNIKKVVDF